MHECIGLFVQVSVGSFKMVELCTIAFAMKDRCNYDTKETTEHALHVSNYYERSSAMRVLGNLTNGGQSNDA